MNEWADILTTYHLKSCPAPDADCTCRMDEVVEGVAQHEAEVKLITEANHRLSGEIQDLLGLQNKLEAKNERLKKGLFDACHAHPDPIEGTRIMIDALKESE